MNDRKKNLVKKLATALKTKGWSLVTAESCTAGGFAYCFSSCPDSSPFLERGYIVYSNESKIQLLDVKQKTLKKYGPVSAQVAKEMVEGALKFSNAQFSIAITGLAGPSGDDTDTPVGTIWFGLAAKKKKTITEMSFFKGSRQNILKKTIEEALILAIDFINSDV